jgi:hypothetical protein
MMDRREKKDSAPVTMTVGKAQICSAFRRAQGFQFDHNQSHREVGNSIHAHSSMAHDPTEASNDFSKDFPFGLDKRRLLVNT